MTKRRFTAGEWTVLGAAVLVLVASFLPWYSLPRVVVLDGYARRTLSAWSGGLAPTTLLPLVVAAAIAVPVLLARLADLHLPERIGGMRCSQLRFVLAAGGLVIAVCELATNRAYGPAGLSRGPGLWLTVLGAAVLLVGVVLDHRPGDDGRGEPADVTPDADRSDAT